MIRNKITPETKTPGMTAGNRKWKSFEDIADWSSAMIPRLIGSFGLEIFFPIQYELADLKPNVLGSFGLKQDEERGVYGVITISPNVIAKKDILSVLLHELIHAHVISNALIEGSQQKKKVVEDVKELKDMKDVEAQKEKLDEMIIEVEGFTQKVREAVDAIKGHQGLFADICREVGYGGKMTATEAKPALVKRLLALDFE